MCSEKLRVKLQLRICVEQTEWRPVELIPGAFDEKLEKRRATTTDNERNTRKLRLRTRCDGARSRRCCRHRTKAKCAPYTIGPTARRSVFEQTAMTEKLSQHSHEHCSAPYHTTAEQTVLAYAHAAQSRQRKPPENGQKSGRQHREKSEHSKRGEEKIASALHNCVIKQICEKRCCTRPEAFRHTHTRSTAFGCEWHNMHRPTTTHMAVTNHRARARALSLSVHRIKQMQRFPSIGR